MASRTRTRTISVCRCVGPRSNVHLSALPLRFDRKLRQTVGRLRILHRPVTRNKPLIAIVDDDESVGRAMERLVRSLGMTAETFVSGEDFINQLESLPSYRVDCVMVDVQMPGMSGIEVQRRIRRVHRDIPVIFITAHDDRLVREKAFAGGAVAFLLKPCNDALIIRTLDAALGRRGSDETADGAARDEPK
jgi:FixJ family two-component response regulator